MASPNSRRLRQHPHRAIGVGTFPGERRPPVGRKALGQHQITVDKVRKAEPRRHPERQARVDARELPPNRWPDDEPEPEHCADLAELGCAIFLGRNVGDIGEGG